MMNLSGMPVTANQRWLKSNLGGIAGALVPYRMESVFYYRDIFIPFCFSAKLGGTARKEKLVPWDASLFVFSVQEVSLMNRVYNFNAGPSSLPIEVLEEMRDELIDFKNTGMGIIEISHRSKEFQNILNDTKSLLFELMELTPDHDIVFIQGGGTMQFLMESYNFLHTRAAYADTGVWAHKARDAASFFGETYDSNSAKDKNYSYIPDEYLIKPNTDYLHITTNNTIYGTAYRKLPEINVPLICDMSSDILSRRIDFNRFSMIWAGIQKNLGAAGMALAILKKDFAATARTDIPPFLQYKTFIEKDSAYNTPPVFCIYTLNKMLHWIKNNGGLNAIETRNIEKAKLIYDAIDNSNGFYKGHAVKKDRSLMNITFNLASEKQKKDFIAKAKENRFIGVNGHRLVGGCRISIYNAVTLDACRAIAQFMEDYQKDNQ